jgi:hypothetical protein
MSFLCSLNETRIEKSIHSLVLANATCPPPFFYLRNGVVNSLGLWFNLCFSWWKRSRHFCVVVLYQEHTYGIVIALQVFDFTSSLVLSAHITMSWDILWLYKAILFPIMELHALHRARMLFRKCIPLQMNIPQWNWSLSSTITLLCNVYTTFWPLSFDTSYS